MRQPVVESGEKRARACVRHNQRGQRKDCGLRDVMVDVDIVGLRPESVGVTVWSDCDEDLHGEAGDTVQGGRKRARSGVEHGAEVQIDTGRSSPVAVNESEPSDRSTLNGIGRNDWRLET